MFSLGKFTTILGILKPQAPFFAKLSPLLILQQLQWGVNMNNEVF
jgi:hypothetical protein